MRTSWNWNLPPPPAPGLGSTSFHGCIAFRLPWWTSVARKINMSFHSNHLQYINNSRKWMFGIFKVSRKVEHPILWWSNVWAPFILGKSFKLFLRVKVAENIQRAKVKAEIELTNEAGCGSGAKHWQEEQQPSVISSSCHLCTFYYWRPLPHSLSLTENDGREQQPSDPRVSLLHTGLYKQNVVKLTIFRSNGRRMFAIIDYT